MNTLNIKETIFKRNYKKLIQLIPGLHSLEIGDALKSHAEGYMDLNLDVLNKENDQMIIALSHYYKDLYGDMIADPDMEMRVAYKSEFVEALAYQDSFGYQRISFDGRQSDLKLKRSLNNFLGQWLENCLAQGHKLKIEIEE